MALQKLDIQIYFHAVSRDKRQHIGLVVPCIDYVTNTKIAPKETKLIWQDTYKEKLL